MIDHPYQYSLELIRKAIDLIPITFPIEEKRAMEREYSRLSADKNATLEDIDQTSIIFSRKIRPYRKAFFAIYDKYAKTEEERYFFNNLSAELRRKYKDFKDKGGRLEDIREGKRLENFFSSEEKLLIDEAEVKARKEVMKRSEDLVLKEKKEEYKKLLREFQEQQGKIEEKLDLLRNLMNKYPSLSEEIKTEIKDIEMGFSITDKDIDLEEIVKIIEYFQGKVSLKK